MSSKDSCTVWRRGKSRDNIKGLPIPIRRSDAFRRDGDRP